MIKYSEAIEIDIYKLIKGSAIAKAVNGKVYRFGFRPFESRKEDIVVEYKQGIEAQWQVGFVYIRVYVPDVSLDSVKVKDGRRCAELQAILADSIEDIDNKTGEYSIRPYDTPMVVATEIEQHYISAYLKYRRLQDN